ncbi:MAG TPA: 3-oxoacyl-ACP reductase [Candidatus Brocadiia bacterium]|nr:3-oxoacyl-ACP reductase [Candidatus Brocadiia bacterium]
MSDFFLNLSGNPAAKKLITKLGLPVPMPPILKRAKGPWEDRPVNDLPVIVCHGKGGALASVMAGTLISAGAEIWLAGENQPAEVYAGLGEAWSRKPIALPESGCPESLRPHGLVFDATGFETADDMKIAYRFFHSCIRQLRSCGRIIVITRPPSAISSAGEAAAARGLQGFTRSMGREVGKKGSTANLITVDADADERLEAVLRFFLSTRSAYISGQPIHVSSAVPSPSAKPLFTKPLEGKIALVTGAARGIGAETAAAMAREGAKVIVMDLPKDEEALKQLAARLGGVPLMCDITAPDAPDAVCNLVAEKFGGLDIAIHNAGITRDKTLGKMDDKLWDQALGVNLLSVIRVNEKLIGQIREGGRIVCLSSIAGIAGNFGQTNYSASKAGIIGYVQALSKELAPKGITVNAMAPGFIETRLTAAIPLMTREVARRLCNLSQGGLPSDVAETAVYLSSPGAVGHTGQILRVCGGSFVGA